jgi:hypothetical protein
MSLKRGRPKTRDTVCLSEIRQTGESMLTRKLSKGLHCNLIALFGMPVGEMFDLEKLAETCKQHGRWTFLFTSSPLNFPGGIASPPNAICIL